MCGKVDHHEGKRKRSDLGQSICIIIDQSQTSCRSLFYKETFTPSQLTACPGGSSGRSFSAVLCGFYIGRQVLIRPRCPWFWKPHISFSGPVQYECNHPPPTLSPANRKWPRRQMWYLSVVLLVPLCTVCPGGLSLVFVPPGRRLRSQQLCVCLCVPSDLQLSS